MFSLTPLYSYSCLRFRFETARLKQSLLKEFDQLEILITEQALRVH